MGIPGERRKVRQHNPCRRSPLQRVAVETLETRRLLAAANLVISEFLASNDTSITDSVGQHEDWIEIHNAGDAPANLNEYFLTDNAGDPEQWRFPVQDLPAGGYLVVFADGTLDAPVANTELHTNFKLGADGEYLGLIRAADDLPQFEYAPTFPPQTTDVSYGLFDSNDPNSTRLTFATPTPGVANTPQAAATIYSVPGKTFTTSLPVTLSSPTPGAVIHYTTDGTLPTAASPTYAGTLTLTNTTMLRTIVTAPSYGSSPVTSQSYIALNSVANTTSTLGSSTVSSFASNLPIVMINTFGTAISDTTLNAASASFIDTTSGTSHALDTPNYDGRIGFRIRGSTSENYPKKQYSIELWDEGNDDKKASLLGLPADSDWVLYAPYTEKAMMQNALAYQWANQMGHYASRTRFVEVFLNTSAVTPGGVASPTTSADYIGIFILEEKIKITDSRVNVDQISVSNPNGGWIISQDRNDGGTESFFNTSGYGVRMINTDPDVHSITPAEKTTITNNWNEWETALRASDFGNPASPNYYGNYIDVRSFVDYYLINEMMRNIDSFWLSTYYTKQADTTVGSVTTRGLISAGPVWDFNLALGMANYNQSANSAGWDTDLLSPAGPGVAGFPQQDPYFQRLLTDANFQQAVSDRWADLRSGIFATPKLMADIDANVTILANGTTNYPIGPAPAQPATNPIVRNFIRWPELGVYVATEGLYDPNGNWINDINLAKGWLTGRVNWMDSQFVPKPIVTPGGNFGSTVNVTMSPLAKATTTDTTILAEGAPVQWFVPTASFPATGWQFTNYVFPSSPAGAVWSSGVGGVGYDTTTTPVNFLPFIGSGSNVQSKMLSINPSVFTRWTFNVADPNAIGALILKMRDDDGFVAWINGVRVMDANSVENSNPTYNSATNGGTSGDDNLAITLREFNISAVKSLLVAGTNVLAIQGLNSGSGSGDVLVSPMLVSRQYTNAATGSIYYTTDGSDPRTSAGGISPTAILYSGAVPISSDTRIRARTLVGGLWSAQADNVYVFSGDALRVTELMYHPAPGDGFPTENFEFIEAKNISASPLNLNGYAFSDGVVFTFPDYTLAPGAYAVIAHDTAAFASRYGSSPSITVLGQFTSGSFDNDGEHIAISNGFTQVVQEFTYDDTTAWYKVQADGGGYSLVIRDPTADKTTWNDPAAWRASYLPQGLPGQDDTDNIAPQVQSESYESGAANRVQFFFSEPVALSASPGVSVSELVSAGAITPAGISAAGNVVTVTLPGSAADGIFRVTLAAGAAVDTAGNPMSAGDVFTYLVVADGHTFVVPPGDAAYAVDQSAIGVGATLDLKDNNLILRGGDVNATAALIAAGRNSGGWNAAGIVTTMPDAQPPGSLTTLAVAKASDALGLHNAETTVWNGHTVGETDVLIKYSYAGDANLDGKINIDDYIRIDAGIAVGINGWFNGDFNFDGKLNIDDYLVIDNNVANQGPPFGNASALSGADDLIDELFA